MYERYNISDMLPRIISIILNIVYVLVLNLGIYTDRAVMPNGNVREWTRSPIDRLNIMDQTVFLYLQIFFTAVTVISAVLLLLGIQHHVLKKVWLISFIVSTLLFVIILVITSNAHAKYA